MGPLARMQRYPVAMGTSSCQIRRHLGQGPILWRRTYSNDIHSYSYEFSN